MLEDPQPPLEAGEQEGQATCTPGHPAELPAPCVSPRELPMGARHGGVSGTGERASFGKALTTLPERANDDQVVAMAGQVSSQISSQTSQTSQEEAVHRILETYASARSRIDGEAHVLEGTDIDGWGLDPSQFDLVEEVDDDLTELRILLECAKREGNRDRLRQAIQECLVKLRVRRTWAWFPLPQYEWSGFEYEKPVITLDFHIPKAGQLAPENIHCDFGVDWFDLKVWNVVWPDDPTAKYHHRVKKTRLMRDIVPTKCSVKASGNHLYVHLQKVSEPRHGYCAWPDLTAGKGRKPFKYREDAPDGGLMEFFEGEYEKHEGYDGFRRDIGKAMEKIHRGEPIRGVPDTPPDED
mmetsp:Transcript_2896/g.6771  ORF Transcript_2896/g.6771 Transcript_2896/m.6771 type:complete len:354 (-) Transcript_2896:211-1272(-)